MQPESTAPAMSHVYCSICQADIRITEGTDDEVSE